MYFHLGGADFSIGLNLFSKTHEEDRHLIASGIVGALENIWYDSWGPRLALILHNAVAALAHSPNASLLGVNRIPTDDAKIIA